MRIRDVYLKERIKEQVSKHIIESLGKDSLLKFYKNREQIPKLVIGFLNDEDVIYGATAINKQLPDYLQVHTFDVDASSNDPENEVKTIEKKLDEWFGEDIFYIEPAKHQGTWKIKNRVDNKTVADLTKVDEPIEFVTIDGKKYSTQEYSLKKIDQSLLSNDPASLDRRNKDIDAKQRIMVGRNIK